MHPQIQQMLESFLKIPVFSQSKLIKILLKHSERINFSNKVAFFDGLLEFYQREDDIQVVVDSNLNGNNVVQSFENPVEHDYRIKSILAANFKGIPLQSEGFPYGIDFCIDDEPRSTIILGVNGSGKSSIFSGIEMIYTQKISEKILRTIEKPTNEDFIKYYKRIPGKQEAQFDILTMNDRQCSLENPLNPLEEYGSNRVSNYFISENDITTIGKLDFGDDQDGPDSFTSFIAQSLGFSEIVDFNKFIMTVNKYNRSKEVIESERLLRQHERLGLEIIDLQKVIEEKNKVLNSLLENSGQLPEDQSKFYEFIMSLKMTLIPFKIDQNKLIPTIRKYTDTRYELSNKDNVAKHKEILDFLSLGIKLLDSSENCPFCRDSKKSKSVIKDDVKSYLAQIKEHYKLIEELEFARNEIVHLWKSLDQSLKNLTNMLSVEAEAIIGQKELVELYNLEKSLINSISAECLDTEYWGKIREIINDASFDDKDLLIADILSQQKESDIYNFIKRIFEFIGTRDELLVEVMNGLEDVSRAKIQHEAVLKNEIESMNKQLERTKAEFENNKVEKGHAEMKLYLIQEIKSDLHHFLGEMNKYLENLIDGPFRQIEPNVLEVMSDYLSTPNSEIGLKIEKKQKIEIKEGEKVESFYYSSLLHIKNGEEDTFVTPDKYFNSFRYGLFCLMLKIAIAISYRAQNKENFPLIVDDLFSSSDYENRNNFAQFLKKVIALFEKHSNNLPLQLILFTHDSLIFRSVMDALDSLNLPNFYKPKFGKLFVPEDRDDIPSVDSNRNKFWNLVRFIKEPSPVKAGVR